MEKSTKNCSELLTETTTDPDVFLNMASAQPINQDKFDLSLRFQFPKFSKNYDLKVFDAFIKENIGKDNLVSLGRLSYPNEFQMELKSKDVREKLIRMARTQIEGRSCWISPLSQSEIRGFVHWLPTAIKNESINSYLEPFGEVLFIENQKQNKWDLSFESDSRYFALKLRPGKTKDDINHFIQVESYRALVTIRGRNPVCFHCKETGHRKAECRMYREKLNSYSRRQPRSAENKRKYRGKRYDPNLAKQATGEDKGKETATDAKAKPDVTMADLEKRLTEQMQITMQMIRSSLPSKEVEKPAEVTEEVPKEEKKKKKKKKKKTAEKPTDS